MLFTNYFSCCRPNKVATHYTPQVLRNIREEKDVLYADLAKAKSKLVSITINLNEKETLFSLSTDKFTRFRIAQNIFYFRQKYIIGLEKFINQLKHLLNLYTETKSSSHKIVQLESIIHIHQVLFELAQAIFNKNQPEEFLLTKLDFQIMLQKFIHLRKHYKPMLHCDLDSYIPFSIRNKIKEEYIYDTHPADRLYSASY